MTEHTPSVDIQEIAAQIEALLFVAPGAVTPGQMAEALGCRLETVEEGLQTLERMYEQTRGLCLQKHGGRVQLTTKPEMANLVERFLGLEATARLSRAALETLAIIAYRQPITRPGVDAIRGVNSDGVLKSLLNKGLLQEVGRSEGPGRPILFATTSEFLQHFGLKSIDELPPFENLEIDEAVPDQNHILKD